MTSPDYGPDSTTDLGSRYGKLLADRDRLIADGANPAELEVPLPPSDERRCDDDFFCGECDDCLTNPDPENLPRGYVR